MRIVLNLTILVSLLAVLFFSFKIYKQNKVITEQQKIIINQQKTILIKLEQGIQYNWIPPLSLIKP